MAQSAIGPFLMQRVDNIDQTDYGGTARNWIGPVRKWERSSISGATDWVDLLKRARLLLRREDCKVKEGFGSLRECWLWKMALDQSSPIAYLKRELTDCCFAEMCAYLPYILLLCFHVPHALSPQDLCHPQALPT